MTLRREGSTCRGSGPGATPLDRSQLSASSVPVSRLGQSGEEAEARYAGPLNLQSAWTGRARRQLSLRAATVRFPYEGARLVASSFDVDAPMRALECSSPEFKVWIRDAEAEAEAQVAALPLSTCCTGVTPSRWPFLMAFLEFPSPSYCPAFPTAGRPEPIFNLMMHRRLKTTRQRLSRSW